MGNRMRKAEYVYFGVVQKVSAEAWLAEGSFLWRGISVFISSHEEITKAQSFSKMYLIAMVMYVQETLLSLCLGIDWGRENSLHN